MWHKLSIPMWNECRRDLDAVKNHEMKRRTALAFYVEIIVTSGSECDDFHLDKGSITYTTSDRENTIAIYFWMLCQVRTYIWIFTLIITLPWCKYQQDLNTDTPHHERWIRWNISWRATMLLSHSIVLIATEIMWFIQLLGYCTKTRWVEYKTIEIMRFIQLLRCSSHCTNE